MRFSLLTSNYGTVNPLWCHLNLPAQAIHMLADISNPSPAPGRKIGPGEDEFSPMLYYQLLMRILPGLLLVALAVAALPAQQSVKPPNQFKPLPGKFTDVTAALGLRFQY